ncbi:glutamine synthetase type III [Chaetoceros tenuissimus]|uniref:Glutamine synthetase type III n=1 Tax=Chaetoceros tenuissimus TaxID=426638 RepID=A0AAD3DAI3_9STRA|nr:glutamine synthetase type III [Chaetoceros tenuissimus]
MVFNQRKTSSRSVSAAKPSEPDPYAVPGFEGYGKHCFAGRVADKYLRKQGASVATLKNPKWVTECPDTIAAAVLDWAVEHGATTYCHWFQPLASSGFRHGQSGQVYNMMVKFDHKTNDLKFDFDGGDLVKGETDGSSYPNGGLRATHTAGGYLAIDTSSPIFLRGDTIFIPSIFVSYYGMALDEKTPLLRANDAMSAHGSRLLKCLGYESAEKFGLKANIGLEQEIFLIPRDQYFRRPDLQYTGRTVMGKMPPRDQEMCDHYMGPLSHSTPALACMKEIQHECFKMGIPLRTRHREVAPNQYEFAPEYGVNSVQIDQNLLVMQLIEEIAAKHGLAALLQEKPFEGINGSGKHNNWSISTGNDIPLFLPGPISKATGNEMAFPIIMAAVVAAIDEHGDLMRMAIASPGNDFRLGCMEAPPAIISTYLGEDMTAYLEAFKEGKTDPYVPNKKDLDIGVKQVVPFKVPAEDRNRTSPFPYGGARFEFRAVGSSQNVSMVNTVLSAMCAEKFAEFADRIEAGEDAIEIAREALKKHWKVIFNGNGYDVKNQEMLTENGVWRIDSGVEAIHRLSDEKNIKFFEDMKVMGKDETLAREECLLDHYTGTVEIEAGAFIDMVNQHVIPSVKKAGVGPLKALENAVQTLKSALKEIHDTEGAYEKAKLARVLRLDTMPELRKVCDAAEEVVPAELWTLATYKELLFLDAHT